MRMSIQLVSENGKLVVNPREVIYPSPEEIKRALEKAPHVKSIKETDKWILAETDVKAGRVYYDILRYLKERGIDVPVSPSPVDKYTVVIPKKPSPNTIYLTIEGKYTVNKPYEKRGLVLEVSGYTYPYRGLLKKLGFRYVGNSNIKYYGENIKELKEDILKLAEALSDRNRVVVESSLAKADSLDAILKKSLEEYQRELDRYLERIEWERRQKLEIGKRIEPIFRKYIELKSEYHNLGLLSKLVREGKVSIVVEGSEDIYGRVRARYCIVPHVNLYEELSKDEYYQLMRELKLLGFERGSGTCKYYLEFPSRVIPSEDEVDKLESILADKEEFLSRFTNYLASRNNRVVLEWMGRKDYIFEKYGDNEYCFIPKHYLGNEWSRINKSFKNVGCYWNRKLGGWCCPPPPQVKTKTIPINERIKGLIENMEELGKI